MKAWVYHQLRRWFSQRTRNRLKAEVFRARQKLRPLHRLRYGTFTAAALRADLAERLPRDFDILMVHSSLNDLAPAYTETASELLNQLIELCGPARTLVMPAFFFGKINGAAEFYKKTPRFDSRRQPSQMGMLSEIFRRRADVLRSLHPTHSVCALGPLAPVLTSTHHLAETTFGKDSPFEVMTRYHTEVIGIGTRYFRILTQIHAAEDMLGEEFPRQWKPEMIPVELVSEQGLTMPYSLACPPNNLEMEIEVLRRLLKAEDLQEWKFCGVPMFRTRADVVTNALIAAAKRGITIYG